MTSPVTSPTSGPDGPSALERATRDHQRRWGAPDVAARAPGRVNLIGEHTDYNDGFVLPMALPFDTAVVMSRAAPDAPSEVFSEGFGHAEVGRGAAPPRPDDWAVHLRGCHQLLEEWGAPPVSWRATIATDIPTGASLSSSAALEVATITGLMALNQIQRSPLEVAVLARRVENEVVGLPSGIMDQLISAGALEGHAALIDCRSLEIEHRRMPKGVAVAVMDTGTRRRLVDSAFAERREACRRAAAALGVESLRDASLDDLDRAGDIGTVERRRAHHVITENRRTLDAADAMSASDVVELGALMNAGHVSLRDDFEVSSPALDRVVSAAQDAPGCLGARMTGGGFAGCAVALVASDRVDGFRRSVVDAYRGPDGEAATIWICEPAGGASIEPLTNNGRA